MVMWIGSQLRVGSCIAQTLVPSSPNVCAKGVCICGENTTGRSSNVG